MPLQRLERSQSDSELRLHEPLASINLSCVASSKEKNKETLSRVVESFKRQMENLDHSYTRKLNSLRQKLSETEKALDASIKKVTQLQKERDFYFEVMDQTNQENTKETAFVTGVGDAYAAVASIPLPPPAPPVLTFEFEDRSGQETKKNETPSLFCLITGAVLSYNPRKTVWTVNPEEEAKMPGGSHRLLSSIQLAVILLQKMVEKLNRHQRELTLGQCDKYSVLEDLRYIDGEETDKGMQSRVLDSILFESQILNSMWEDYDKNRERPSCPIVDVSKNPMLGSIIESPAVLKIKDPQELIYELQKRCEIKREQILYSLEVIKKIVTKTYENSRNTAMAKLAYNEDTELCLNIQKCIKRIAQ